MKRIILLLLMGLFISESYSQQVKLYIHRVQISERDALPNVDIDNSISVNWMILVNKSTNELFIDFGDKGVTRFPIVSIKEIVSEFSGRVINRVEYRKNDGSTELFEYLKHTGAQTGSGVLYDKDKKMNFRVKRIE